MCRAVRGQSLRIGCRKGYLKTHARHQTPQSSAVDRAIRCRLPVGAIDEPSWGKRNVTTEDKQAETVCGLISYDRTAASFSNLNLGELESPVSGCLPPSEPWRCEVLQQADKQMPSHEEAVAYAMCMRVPPCGGIGIEVEQQETTIFFNEVDKRQSAAGVTP